MKDMHPLTESELEELRLVWPKIAATAIEPELRQFVIMISDRITRPHFSPSAIVTKRMREIAQAFQATRDRGEIAEDFDQQVHDGGE